MADYLSAKLAAELSEDPGTDGKPTRFPLMVNASFASMACPQDGYSDAERRWDVEIVKDRVAIGGDARVV
jgi:hypothetical protein